jgi:hypothetical protein
MTATVTLADGGTDKYMRFGHSYIEHKDGTLDVMRGGANTRTATSRSSGPTSTAITGDRRSAVSGVDHSQGRRR